jgi:PEP-CTERM motif
MNRGVRLFVLALFAHTLFVGAQAARADSIVNYQISGPGPNGTFTASFSLPGNPTPSWGGPLAFDFASLPVDLNGKSTDLTVLFDSSALGGGVLGFDGFYLFGPQLFSWPSSSSTPIMDVGTFQLYGSTAGGGGFYTITAIDPPGAVPEPSSILLLGMSTLILFGVHRRRRFA